MSNWVKPMVAREERVEAPTMVTTAWRLGVFEHGERRHTMKTPAVTMVAAWIQRRDRGRAFHRVRQPGVERDLGRLTHGADEEQDAERGQRVGVPGEEVEGLADLIGNRPKTVENCTELKTRNTPKMPRRSRNRRSG